MEKTLDFFERLKQKKTIIHRKKTPDAIFFQLRFDPGGAYLKVIDKKGREVEPRHEYFSGNTRDILKSIESIKNKNSFRIDWELPEDKIYIAENDFLIAQLRDCDHLVNDKLQAIHFEEDSAEIILHLEEQKKQRIQSKIKLSVPGKDRLRFSLLNENHVLAGNKIYRVQPLGENFSDLSLFETTLETQDLEKYLSLLFSHFHAIRLRYENYKTIQGDPRQSRPALIFEKVDDDHSLYLKISTSLPGFEADFFDDYDISKIASVNELDQKITICDVLHEDILACFNDILKRLRKSQRNLEGNNQFHIEDNLIIIDAALAEAFIHHELPHLIPHFTFFGAEKLTSYKVRAVTPKLNLKLSHGIDFLSGEADLEIEGQTFSLFDALRQYKKNAYIALSDGTHAIINRNYIQKLQRIFKKQKDEVKVSFFDLPIIEEMIDKKIADQSFKQSRKIFLGFNSLKKTKPKLPQLNATLRGYQQQGFKWSRYLHKHALGGCLADDMGLGKTLQAIALLASIYPRESKCSLIIMPKSLLFNWENEINRFGPQLTYYTYYGTQRDLDAARSRHLVLTTYAMVRNDIKQFREEAFHYVILDESQNIKNLNSQISKAVMLLNAEHRLALSGTPIENNLGELYALFRFLNPSMFGSVQDFNRHYATPIQKENDKEALHELKKKIYPFILRRLKKDVLKELPDKFEQTLFVDMTPEQQTFYEQRRRFYHQTVKAQIQESGIGKSQFSILQALSELRQIASIPEFKSESRIISPKREILLDHISDLIANDHKILVFANFLNALEGIAENLDAAGIDYLLMTGATRNRKTLVEQFQNDDACKVFLMTLKTGGTGLNLTAADYIFIFDPWWNKAAENQAIDRTHRIGQRKTVFSYKLITRGTIEEKILELQKIKSDLFENLIASDGAAIKTLTEKDVDFVLGD